MKEIPRNKINKGNVIRAISLMDFTQGVEYLILVTSKDKDGVLGHFETSRTGQLSTPSPLRSPLGFFPWEGYAFSGRVSDIDLAEDVVKWLRSMPRSLKEQITSGKL